MRKEALRSMLSDVSDDTFSFLWRLFDSDDSGSVDADEFVIAMALLSADGDYTFDDQLQAAFRMFDADKSGDLTKDEFESMVKATVQLNLGQLLKSKEALDAFDQKLHSEFAEENLDFWQAVQAFKQLKNEEERAERAHAIELEFLADSSERQVNLPSGVMNTLRAAIAGCSKEAPPSLNVFDAAATEIFSLMERDTFSRFKQDPEAIQSLLDSYFSSAAKEGAQTVTYKAFCTWATKEPTVRILFAGLSTNIRQLLDDHTAVAAASPASAIETEVERHTIGNSSITRMLTPPAARRSEGDRRIEGGSVGRQISKYLSFSSRSRTPPTLKGGEKVAATALHAPNVPRPQQQSPSFPGDGSIRKG